MMVSIKDKQDEFYDYKRKVAFFYIRHVLPETVALHQVITPGGDSLATFDVESLDGWRKARRTANPAINARSEKTEIGGIAGCTTLESLLYLLSSLMRTR